METINKREAWNKGETRRPEATAQAQGHPPAPQGDAGDANC